MHQHQHPSCTFPTALIYSLDRRFIADMTSMMRCAGFEVFVATSCRESERLNFEITFDALAIDPRFLPDDAAASIL